MTYCLFAKRVTWHLVCGFTSPPGLLCREDGKSWKHKQRHVIKREKEMSSKQNLAAECFLICNLQAVKEIRKQILKTISKQQTLQVNNILYKHTDVEVFRSSRIAIVA